MDLPFSQFSDSINASKLDEETVLPAFDLSQNLANGFKLKDGPLDSNFVNHDFLPPFPDLDNCPPSLSASSEAESPNNHNSSEISLKHINQILMEENMEDKPGMFYDPAVLQAAEKSLYEVIGEKDSPSSSTNSESSTARNSSSKAISPQNQDSSDIILKYVNQILMEENIEEKPSMFHDPMALQAAEKSLYEVIGEKYPPLPDQPSLYFNQHIESLGGNIFESSSMNTANSSASNSIYAQRIIDRGEYKSSVIQSHPLEYSSQSTLQTSLQWPFGSMNSFGNNVSGKVDPSVSSHVVSNMFGDSKSILQYKKGVEDTSKLLPNANQFIIDLGSYALPPKSREGALMVAVEAEKDARDYSPSGSLRRKNHHWEDSDFQVRSCKQTAVNVEEAELSEMFDRLSACNNVKGEPACCNVDEEMKSEQLHLSNGGKARCRNQVNKKEKDLRNLLIKCAQCVAADDCMSAYEQLMQIREHSSPSGDGTQRLAHIFANGLEARLAGTGSQIYAALASNRISTAEKLKAYQLYLSACPFNKMATFFAGRNILDLAEKAAKKKLHIVDFGILYGFQWPILIQRLSTIPGGPPKLRITGIEHPQPGFRPAELVEETGRRLMKYCERFNVPFEYHAIAQKWETIKIEDLKIGSDEVLAVNTLMQFKNLLDETVVENSPRDTVLRLIRELNPNIFIHSVVNGSYSTPFFVTRFREALFHYSSWFDMFDTIMTRDDLERLNLEKEFYGREVMNVIACEGLERVERPETYKRWQIRNMRFGFRLLPLNHEAVKKLRVKVKAGYHKDFMIDEEGDWMLQGWKGRILCASSCWVPA